MPTKLVEHRIQESPWALETCIIREIPVLVKGRYRLVDTAYKMPARGRPDSETKALLAMCWVGEGKDRELISERFELDEKIHIQVLVPKGACPRCFLGWRA